MDHHDIDFDAFPEIDNLLDLGPFGTQNESENWDNFMSEWNSLPPPAADETYPAWTDPASQNFSISTSIPGEFLTLDASISQPISCTLAEIEVPPSFLNTWKTPPSLLDLSGPSPGTNPSFFDLIPSPSSSLNTQTSSPQIAYSDGRSPPSSEPPPSEVMHVCNVCRQSFAKKHLLNRHLNQHIKPVQCPVTSCRYRTAKKREMQRHIDVHHSDDDVGAQYTSRIRHLCPANGCEYAKRGFKRRDHLTRHITRVH